MVSQMASWAASRAGKPRDAAPNAVSGLAGHGAGQRQRRRAYTVYTDIDGGENAKVLPDGYYNPGAGNENAAAPLKGFASGVTIDYDDPPTADTHGVVTFATAADLAAAANAGTARYCEVPAAEGTG